MKSAPKRLADLADHLSANDAAKIAFMKIFAAEYFSRPFGTMPKSELDFLIFRALVDKRSLLVRKWKEKATMSTIRFVANAFRIMIEIINWSAALLLLVVIFGYIFNRDEIRKAANSFGFYTDLTIAYFIVTAFITHILVMGLLCVILEIRESLKRIENNKEVDFEKTKVGRERKSGIEPTF